LTGSRPAADGVELTQRQTFGNFEAIISVDGTDAEKAAACRPCTAT
jgi:hypothetical protein